MQNLINKNGRKGQGLVEYILVVFLMAIVCIAGINSLSTSTQKGFTKSSKALDAEFAK